ncbi:MAG: GNAT family N-acetyltransferase [Paracoccaceae bacterium]|nr:GNAT family N-acetyltransferase [Paracoccaceae bacterium]
MLRPLEMTDADALVEGVGNYDVSRWLAVVPYPYARVDAETFISRVQDRGMLVWAVCDADGLQGVCGVDEELGYWLARPIWRKGYAFEAARAVVAHWFGDPRRGDLESGYFNDNERSGELLRALGFQTTGQSRRHAKSLSQTVDATDMVLTRSRWEERERFEIKTPRLAIRPMKMSDAPDLSAMIVPEIARNFSSLGNSLSIAEAETVIRDYAFRGFSEFDLGIEKDGALIGTIGFGKTPLSINYLIGKEHWGQGIMTEALSVFLPELFERFPVTRIAAYHFEDNPASGAVLRKMGFEETGRGTRLSKARLEPAPIITYALTRDRLRVPA